MAEVYVTLSEAAELEGVQYQTMARRTQRNGTVEQAAINMQSAGIATL